jgi:hypothetical protein
MKLHEILKASVMLQMSKHQLEIYLKQIEEFGV